MKPIKAITIDFDPIEQSMRDLCRVSNDYYLHKSSGKVVVLSKGVIKFLTEDHPDERREVLPEWETKMIPVARQIISNGSVDFVRIPEAFGQPEHAWMKNFADDIRSAKLKQNIYQALRGRGACRRFKEILSEFPDETRRWTQFRAHCWREKIQAWLEEFGILAVDENPKKPRSAVR